MYNPQNVEKSGFGQSVCLPVCLLYNLRRPSHSHVKVFLVSNASFLIHLICRDSAAAKLDKTAYVWVASVQTVPAASKLNTYLYRWSRVEGSQHPLHKQQKDSLIDRQRKYNRGEGRGDALPPTPRRRAAGRGDTPTETARRALRPHYNLSFRGYIFLFGCQCSDSGFH